MRQEDDFAAYLAARWASLVQTLVLLGSPQPVAEDVALTTAARCRSHWAQLRESGDVDVHVHRMLLECRASDRTPWWEADPEPTGPAEEHLGDVRLRRRLEEALDALTPDARAALVLRYAARLAEEQVAEVLGVGPDRVRALLDRALGEVDLDALRGVAR